jgi:hypothetical protein
MVAELRNTKAPQVPCIHDAPERGEWQTDAIMPSRQLVQYPPALCMTRVAGRQSTGCSHRCPFTITTTTATTSGFSRIKNRRTEAEAEKKKKQGREEKKGLADKEHSYLRNAPSSP